MYFEKDSDLVNSLHSLLGGNFTLNISIHLIIKENGFIIGFLATGFKPLKYLIRYNEISKNTSCNTCKEINYLKAKSVFLNSFSEFSELIQTDSLKKSLYKEKWIEKISLIDQEGHLMDLFKQNADNFGDWFQLLKSWGLKSDQCKQIPGAIVNKNLYDIVEQMSTIEDCMYEVIQPCWTIWIDSNGTRQEKLVAKGLLKKI